MNLETNNIIPINKPMIDALAKILELLKDKPWNGPEKFNAIFIDRKGFMKQAQLPNPPPPIYHFPLIARLEIKMVERLSLDRAFIKPETVEFRFYRRIGDTLEYREFI